MNIEIFKLEEELNRFILSAWDYSELVSEAFSSNIHISVQLEGNPLSKKDVRRLTRGVIKEGRPMDAVDFPVQEVLNHIIAYLSPRFSGRWDLDTIKDVHRLLMSGDPDHMSGEFRTEHTAVFSSEGQELFIPAPFQHIEEEMTSLLSWLNSTPFYPVVAGAVFFHEFESIHPFLDGNGRCGRSLFHIYLQHRGLMNSKLCFIEQNIVDDPEKYYDLLAKTDHSGDYTSLVEHITKGVHKSYSAAVDRYREKDLLGSQLDETSKRALAKAKEYKKWFSLETAKEWFHNISDYKLRKRLRELVQAGGLEEKGSTRSKMYKFADPLEDLPFEFHKREDAGGG